MGERTIDTSDVGTKDPMERWQLAGNAPEIYERHLVPAVFGPWAPVLVGEAGNLAGKRVLDVACGTGVVARAAAERVGRAGRVVGLDNNPGMLEVARSHPDAIRHAIEWHEASVEQMPFRDSTFDVVFCQLGLQYFADRQTALTEMHRVLTLQGTLVFMVWRSIMHSPGFETLAEALEHHVSSEAVTIMRAPFVFEDDAEHLRDLVVAAGFHDVTIRSATGAIRFGSVREFVEQALAGSPLAVPVGKATQKARRALLDEVCEALVTYESAEGLIFPIEAHVARATA